MSPGAPSRQTVRYKDRDPPKLYINTQSSPRSKHYISVIKTSQLILCREIIAAFSQIHTKHINTLCGQNVELLHAKLLVHLVTGGL